MFLSEYDSDFPAQVRMITAAIRGIRKGDLLADGIFMKFKFDDRDRLVTFIVGYGYTGP